MTDRVITDSLAERVLGWRPAPDRFMTGERSWIPRSRFRPFKDVRDALRLVEQLTRHYSLTADATGFTAEVRYRDYVGRATAENNARAITLAVAHVIDLDAAVSIRSMSQATTPPCELKVTPEAAR